MKNILYLLIFFISFVQGYGQENCRYPFDQSADSLINFVIAESVSKGGFSRVNYRDEYREKGHDEAFKECVKDLKTKIGDSLFCSNIEMNPSSFYKEFNTNVYKLTFRYTIPVINEIIGVTYKYKIINGKAEVVGYPHNLPTLSISEINITRDQVIEILKNKNILREDDVVNMWVNGNRWYVRITNESNHDSSRYFRSGYVHMKTGELLSQTGELLSQFKVIYYDEYWKQQDFYLDKDEEMNWRE